MKLYVSGGINGITNAVERFARVAEVLRSRGYEVVNPYDVPACADSPCTVQRAVPPGSAHAWECYLRHDLIAMLGCDAVGTLRGWEASRGARLEVATAVQVGMPVKPWSQWTWTEEDAAR